MFFTMKQKNKLPFTQSVRPLEKVSLANVTTKDGIRNNLHFGMISRIQEKTFCFSCGK